MPFTERGVGSAWGLPVVASGKERLSALSLSEKLEPPGTLSISSDPFRAERLLELEALGVGPLGRYLGGEPVKPVRLGPEDFFKPPGSPQSGIQAFGRKSRNGAAELFCAALEFDNTHWVDRGTVPELFRGHLEFLRTWGFSGGLHVEEASLPPLMAEYVNNLEKETAPEKPPARIVVLVSKRFFETRLAAELPNARPGGDKTAGEIPVNHNSEGGAVLGPDFAGLGIALYEDILPPLRAQRARCDILITVKTGPAESISAEGIAARLKLTVNAVQQKDKQAAVKRTPLNTFLFRDIKPVKSGGLPTALPFPANSRPDWGTGIKRIHGTPGQSQSAGFSRQPGSRQPGSRQPGAQRHTAGCCVFEVNTKFSGLMAADFKEEQSLFYREGPAGTHHNREPPPVKPGVGFSGLHEAQREFFFRWRNECRRGFAAVPSGSLYIESYILLYARELVLCMGRESPLEHFLSLMGLFRASWERYPETAAILCRALVDFAVIYGITGEAVPLLLDELRNGRFGTANDKGAPEMLFDPSGGPPAALLFDLALHHFFIEKAESLEGGEFWPLIRVLIPPKILDRKENDPEHPARCCGMLAVIDTGLRRSWKRGFFSLFCPPLPVRADYTAFEKGRLGVGGPALGDSSYTAYRPDFSSHKPLLDVMSALALQPEINPLPGVEARLHPLSLENELLEELRKESDAVRDILKPEYDADDGADGRTRAGRTRRSLPNAAVPETDAPQAALTAPAYTSPGSATLAEFIASLEETQRSVIRSIAASAYDARNGGADAAIDDINSAFYERFGDLLIETGPDGASISAEYQAILREWE